MTSGDEGNYPLSCAEHSMYAGVNEAIERGIPLTIHAGKPKQLIFLDKYNKKINLDFR